MKAVCTETCTTPEHGYVEEGKKVEFESWDTKNMPYLKRFKKVSVDMAGTEPASGGDEPPDEDPVVEALGKRVIAMTPDELDKVSPKNIGEAYGIPWHGRKKDDVVVDAIKKDKGE